MKKQNSPKRSFLPFFRWGAYTCTPNRRWFRNSYSPKSRAL